MESVSLDGQGTLCLVSHTLTIPHIWTCIIFLDVASMPRCQYRKKAPFVVSQIPVSQAILLCQRLPEIAPVSQNFLQQFLLSLCGQTCIRSRMCVFLKPTFPSVVVVGSPSPGVYHCFLTGPVVASPVVYTMALCCWKNRNDEGINCLNLPTACDAVVVTRCLFLLPSQSR